MGRARRPLVFLVPLFLLISLTTAGCGAMTPAESAHAPAMPAMASMAGMPEEVQMSPVAVKQAYQFAAANPALIQNIPCYCGCVKVGHKSNYDCYVKDAGASGNVTYDLHAVGCSICVDITQDVRRLLRDGKGAGEIRTYIEGAYSKYGPSTSVEQPQKSKSGSASHGQAYEPA